MKKTVSLPFMLLAILFCVCLITSNLLSTKLIQVAGFFTITGGLFVFPLLFIINDCIAEVWGYKKTRLVIWMGFAGNFFVLAFAQLAVLSPSPEFWDGEAGFNFVFRLAPRITIASFTAFLAGSFLNAYVMSRMKIASNGRHFSIRAMVSTLAGQTLDSFIFFPIAFFGLIHARDLFVMILVQICIKSLYEFFVLPVTIRVVKYLKKFEDSDIIDKDISYNVFKISDF